MANLVDVLLKETSRTQVIDDCVSLVESEVSSKSGLSGIAVKGAYSIIKRIKPNVVRDAVEKLLPDFAQRLEPFVTAHQSGATGGLEEHFNSRKTEVANALLSITDERAERMEMGPMRSAYGKLRPAGVKHVEAAVPGIAKIIAKYV